MLKRAAFLSLFFLSMVAAQVCAQTAYTIPGDLTPVTQWAGGFTAKEAEAFQKAYQASDYPSGNDKTAFAYLNLSEILPVMIIPQGGRAAGLGGQAIYVSPETDTVIVYFSTTWQNSLSMVSYARAIGKKLYRTK